MAADYRKYKPGKGAAVLFGSAGFAAAFAGSYIMFALPLISLICGAVAVWPSYVLFVRLLGKKRRKKLLMQFRDMLDSLNGSFSSGQNLFLALDACATDLCALHGESGMITIEARRIAEGIRNGGTASALFTDFAYRSGLEDITDFADTFAICERNGGDLSKIVSECREVICAKISAEAEISSLLASNRNELYIMSLMPFVIALVTGGTGMSSGSDPSAEIAARALACLIFVAALLIGIRITDVRV